MRPEAATRRTAIGLMSMAGATALLGACGGSGKPSGTPTRTSTSTSSIASAQQRALQRLARSDLTGDVLPSAPGTHVAVNETAVVVGDAPQATIDEIARLAAAYEPTLLAMSGTQRPSDPVLLIAPASLASFKALADNPRINPEIDGITYSPHGSYEGWMLLRPEAGGQIHEHVIAHELFHALTLRSAASDHRPLWLIEGFAELAAATATEQINAPAALPSASHLPTDDEMKTVAAYFLAFTFALYLSTLNSAAVNSFYTPAVSGTSSLDSLAHKTFGQNLSALEAGWIKGYPTEISQFRRVQGSPVR